MSGRGAATRIEVCFISELYTLLRLLKASAEGVFMFQDVDVEVKINKKNLSLFFFCHFFKRSFRKDNIVSEHFASLGLMSR